MLSWKSSKSYQGLKRHWLKIFEVRPLLVSKVLTSMKKDVVQRKNYLTATQILDFLVLELIGFLALFYFFYKKR